MREILGLPVESGNYDSLVRQVTSWAKQTESRAVVFANVHVVMEAHDDDSLRSKLKRADLINPDGVPLVWALKALGESHATRVYGPDATGALLAAAELENLPVGFYGGSDSTLIKLVSEVKRQYPSLAIAFAMSPPFRPLTPMEDDEVTRAISSSGVRLLFVGLGCPKQEHWAIDHRGRIPAVMLAVGAAFDFLAGSKPQAPRWMMRSGLEWLFRLGSEPRRLAGRYVKHNPRFVLLFFVQWLRQKSPKTAGS